MGAGGWFVCNSAILAFLASHEEVKASLGDAEYLRQPGGVYDFLSGHSSRLDLLKIVVGNLNAGCRYKLGPLFGIERSSPLNNIFHQDPLFHAFMIKNVLSNKRDTSVWVQSLLRAWNNKNQPFILLQNPFYYTNIAPLHYEIWNEIFSHRSTLMVFRDPRDQFADLMKKGQLFHTNPTLFREGSESMSPIDRFFYLNERILDGREHLIQQEKGKILAVSFDKFISEFESEAVRIRKFVGLSGEGCTYTQADLEFSALNKNIWLSDTAIVDAVEKNDCRFASLKKRNLNLFNKIMSD